MDRTAAAVTPRQVIDQARAKAQAGRDEQGTVSLIAMPVAAVVFGGIAAIVAASGKPNVAARLRAGLLPGLGLAAVGAGAGFVAPHVFIKTTGVPVNSVQPGTILSTDGKGDRLTVGRVHEDHFYATAAAAEAAGHAMGGNHLALKAWDAYQSDAMDHGYVLFDVNGNVGDPAKQKIDIPTWNHIPDGHLQVGADGYRASDTHLGILPKEPDLDDPSRWIPDSSPDPTY
jgi:hypothetical protein